MKHLFEEIGIEYQKKVTLFTDAEAALKAAHNPGVSQLTKHYAVKYWWTQLFVGEGAKAFVEMMHVPTLMMVVDNLTKVASELMMKMHTEHMMGYLGRTTYMVRAAIQKGGWARGPNGGDLSIYESDWFASSSEEDSD